MGNAKGDTTKFCFDFLIFFFFCLMDWGGMVCLELCGVEVEIRNCTLGGDLLSLLHALLVRVFFLRFGDEGEYAFLCKQFQGVMYHSRRMSRCDNIAMRCILHHRHSSSTYKGASQSTS